MAATSLSSSALLLLIIVITITLPLLRHPSIIIATASPLTLASPSDVNATATPARCIDSSAWVTPKFMGYDCYSAISLFEDYEVYRHSTTVYEFLSASLVPPSYPQFSQPTPRKYVYKSCTMAIVMLADILRFTDLPGLPPPSPFPPGAPGAWPRTDLADFVAIHDRVVGVRDVCLSVVGGGGGGSLAVVGSKGEEGAGGTLGFANPGGYDTAGFAGAIGVFLWDTDSPINQAVQEGVAFGVRGGNVTGLGGGGRVLVDGT